MNRTTGTFTFHVGPSGDNFPPPVRPPELEGTIVEPRLRWSCLRCGKRNMSDLQPPLAPSERVACHFCHSLSVFHFKPTERPEAP